MCIGRLAGPAQPLHAQEAGPRGARTPVGVVPYPSSSRHPLYVYAQPLRHGDTAQTGTPTLYVNMLISDPEAPEEVQGLIGLTQDQLDLC